MTLLKNCNGTVQVYNIEVTIGVYKWQVRHRYSDFYELHEKLSLQFNLERSMLPRKKLFGNQSEKFVCKRQKELEQYLQSLLSNLPKIPYALMVFLDFHKYEVHGIIQTLSEFLFDKGDDLLKSDKTFHMTPLQIYSLCSRLKLPEPVCDADEACRDLGHLLDFVTRVRHLQIDGSVGLVGTSNVKMNELAFDLHCFKSLTTLELVGCNVQMLSEVEHLKKNLVYIRSYNSVNQLKDLLLVGVGISCWSGIENETLIVQAWSEVITADFSHNHISVVDESIKLMPRVERLSLRHNRLDDVTNLQFLSSLRILDVSHNRIYALTDLHARLGNITALNLSWNKLETLQGLAKVYSLQALDVSFNEISQVMELRYLSGLPCLERLNLQGNSVTSILDYRTTIFELFVDRAGEICLDGQKANSMELDTVAVRAALHKARELKSSLASSKAKRKSVAREAFIADLNQSESSEASQLGSYDNDVPSINANTPSRVADSSSIAKQSVSVTQSYNMDSGSQLQEIKTESIALDFPLGYQAPWYKSRLLVGIGIEDSSRSTVNRYFMLPETLPGCNDKQFVSHLMTDCLDSETLCDNEEVFVHVMWCVAVCYTNPDIEFPACILVSTRFIHVFSVESLGGCVSAPYPAMRRVFCIPLVSLQRVAVGYEGLYVQIEESQVGDRGVFTLLTLSCRKTDLFVDSLKRAVRHTIPDLDAYEDPNIVSVDAVDKLLLPFLSEFELPGAVTINLYTLVVTRNGFEEDKFVTRSAVISSRYIYLLKQDYANQPSPTYVLSASTSRPSLEVLAVFPLNGRVVNVQMYDDCVEIDSTPGVGNTTGRPWRRFSGFGVCLTFNLGGSSGVQSLDIRMPTSCQRDSFLTSLMHARPRDADSISMPLLGQTSGYKLLPDRIDASVKKTHRKLRMSKKDAVVSVNALRGFNKHIDFSKSRTSSAPNLATLSRERQSVDGILTSEENQKLCLSVAVLPCFSSEAPVSASQQDTFRNYTKNAEENDEIPFPRHIDCELDPHFLRATTQLASQSDNLDGFDNSPDERVVSDFLASNEDPGLESPKVQQTCSANDQTTAQIGAAMFAECGEISAIVVESVSSDTQSRSIREVSSSSFEGQRILMASDCVTSDYISADYSSHDCSVLTSADVDYEPAENLLPSADHSPYFNLGYPSEDLLARLSCCRDKSTASLRQSPALQALGAVSGLAMVNYFHMAIAAVGPESANEQLCHVLFTPVVLYDAPTHEIPSIVYLSSRTLYVVSDEDTPTAKAFKSHARHFSDDTRHIKGKNTTQRWLKEQASSEGSRYVSCGPLSEMPSHRDQHRQRPARVYVTISIKDLRYVHVGLFDQAFRLTSSDSTVLACLTRDHRLTHEFIKQLNEVLSRPEHAVVSDANAAHVAAPLDAHRPDEELDFYHQFTRYQRQESVGCKHSKHVRICYPLDESVADLSFVVRNALRGYKLASDAMKIHFYLLCFQVMETSCATSGDDDVDSFRPVSLVITDEHLALAVEDYVSYPLPDFVRLLPDQPHTEIIEVRCVEHLINVVLSDANSSRLKIVFTEDSGEIVVEPHLNHFGEQTSSPTEQRQTTGEVVWQLFVQNSSDRDKLVKVVDRQWRELNGALKPLNVLHEA